MRKIEKIGWSLCVGLTASAARADGPFLSISFDEACKKAAAEKKLVFLDFYTTWCSPCKMMDRTTWKDPKVIDFLRTKVVALAIDADKDAPLAEKFRVSGFPTLIYAKPDSTVVELAVGYVDPGEFLVLSEQVAAGRDSLTRAAEAVKKRPDDPVARVQLAETLSSRGQYREASSHLVPVLESSAITPVGVSVLPMAVYQLYSLSEHDPEIEKTVQKLYDAAAKAVSERTASDAQLALYSAVNLVNSEPGKTLSTYDELRSKEGNEAFVSRATRIWAPALIAEERFEDVVKHLDVVAAVKEMLVKLPSGTPTTSPASQKDSDPEAVARRQLIMQTLDFYKVLLLAGREDAAAQVAQEALRVEQSPAMYEALAWTGYSTGKPLAANLEQARKAHELSGGKDSSVIDTLARVLHKMGKKEEAVTLVKEAQQRAEDEFEREMLARCLQEISAE